MSLLIFPRLKKYGASLPQFQYRVERDGEDIALFQTLEDARAFEAAFSLFKAATGVEPMLARLLGPSSTLTRLLREGIRIFQGVAAKDASHQEMRQAGREGIRRS